MAIGVLRKQNLTHDIINKTMTKKELQSYFRAMGVETSYSGNDNTLYIHSPIDVMKMDVTIDTRGINLEFEK